MKKGKMILLIASGLAVLTFSAFKLKKDAPPKTAQLYWYTVVYDAGHPNGYIPSSGNFFVQDDKSNVISPCSPGANKDCLRGFDTQLTSFPVSSTGMDQIKKP